MGAKSLCSEMDTYSDATRTVFSASVRPRHYGAMDFGEKASGEGEWEQSNWHTSPISKTSHAKENKSQKFLKDVSAQPSSSEVYYAHFK